MKRRKDYDTKASVRNTPHLKEKTWIIGLSYAFSGVNFIACGLGIFGAAFDIYAVFLGAVLLCMVPVSVLDDRKEMRGTLAAALAAIMHLGFCVALAFTTYSFWWMAVYAGEVALGIAVILLSRKGIFGK